MKISSTPTLSEIDQLIAYLPILYADGYKTAHFGQIAQLNGTCRTQWQGKNAGKDIVTHVCGILRIGERSFR